MFTSVRGVFSFGARLLELHVSIGLLVCHNGFSCEHDILKANGYHLQYGADIELECAYRGNEVKIDVRLMTPPLGAQARVPNKHDGSKMSMPTKLHAASFEAVDSIR